MSGFLMRGLEALAFSSILPACVAGALTLAAALSLVDNSAGSQLVAGLAFAGTLVVYNVDRLRDLERDWRSSPLRSAFVSRHRAQLIGLVIIAGSAAATLGWQAGPAAIGLCAAVFVPALFHRRIKRQHPSAKAAYVTTAWVAAVVGLPALSAMSALTAPPGAQLAGRIALIAGVYAAAIGANLIASNLRDTETARSSPGAVWRARGFAVVGVLIALAGPPSLRVLAWVPLAQLAGLTGFRGGERARLLVIDSSLLVGALAVLALKGLR